MRLEDVNGTRLPGHVLRGGKSSDGMVALGCQPEGKRAVGRPETTWRRTLEAERRKAGWRDWGTARVAAKDREAWRENVTALCVYWGRAMMMIFGFKLSSF